MSSNKYEIKAITDPRSLYAESFRRLQVNLQYASVDKPYRVIQVISSKPGEGKTTTSLNLAAIYAEKKKKVIVVDLDLRNPKIHRAFKLHANQLPGVTEFILGKAKLDEIIYKNETGIDVITRGEKISFPETLLDSRNLEELINSLREKYDYVILDCPPVLVATDPILISKYADCQVFVISYMKTKKIEAVEAVKIMRNAKANIAGTIITGVKKTTSYKEKYYYGYYSYDEYGGYSRNKGGRR